MRRYLLLIATILVLQQPLWAQNRDRHDRMRYDQMNQQGVWSVGVSAEPFVSMVHPLGDALGGGSLFSSGIMGFMVEGGYFVVDNLRLSLSVGYVGDSWGNMFRWNIYDSYTELSQFKVRLGGFWHMGRLDVGTGLSVGNTTFDYFCADTTMEGVNDPHYGSEDIRDRHTTLGIFCQAGYMFSPFLKLSAFYEPSVAFGGGYSHLLGARLTIYLPFVNAVVCR